jgi:hypothetical protein
MLADQPMIEDMPDVPGDASLSKLSDISGGEFEAAWNTGTWSND